MTDSTDLERRYRRLLAFYPKSYRRQHEREILSVLMAGAAPDQRRPRPAESGDLLKSALRMRLRYGVAWESTHHPGLWLWIRLLSGIWLVILTGILCSYGRWWGLALLAPAVLHFYLAARLGRIVDNDWGSGSPPSVGGS